MDSCVDLSPEEYRVAEITPAQNLLEKALTQHRVVVFSKSQCPYCENSKQLLNSLGVNYEVIELDRLKEGGDMQNLLGQLTGARTVPRIFVDGKCIGGNSDLTLLNNTGALKNVLKDLWSPPTEV